MTCDPGDMAVRDDRSLGARAADLGHAVAVQSTDGRFRLVCSCGWKTPITARRKTAFRLVDEHVFEVVFAGRRVAG